MSPPSGRIVAVDKPTKRAERIQSPSVTLSFRHPGDGHIFNADVWREDILEWQPDARFPPQFYLVLDFGTEESVVMKTEAPRPEDGVNVGENIYAETGRIQLDLQPIKIESPDEWNMETGEGLGPPVSRFADIPTDELGDEPGSEPLAGRPMVGWVPHPVSPRRDA